MKIHGGELTITKIFSFCYAHKLPEYKGKCANIHGHGATLEVEIKKAPIGTIVYDGMIMDFGDIKFIIQKEVVNVMDHKYLNEDVQHFIKVSPTAENIVEWIVCQLGPIFTDGLARVCFYETPTSYAEWKR
jgi:6-pyruvoyltetrahydropterin/6-carboxytetrahydropterin synthase